MKLENKEKQLLKVLLLAILFYFVLLRIDSVTGTLAAAGGLLKPFIIGGAMAFIINVPMVKVEKYLEKKRLKKGRRALAFFITLTLMLAAVALFLTIVVPQLVQAVSTLADHLQQLTDKIPALLENHSSNLTFIEEYIASLNINWQNIGQQLIDWLKAFALALVGSGSGLVGGVVSGFTTAVLSIIFSIYLLFGKENVSCGLTRLTKAVAGEKISAHIFHVCSIAYRSFSNFLSGQCLEAVILGCMFIAAMTVFRMPYAFLVGVVIAVTALIPVFGAFIGGGVGVVVIAIENPVQALWFLLLFIVLQQLEGNLIYPKVVGNSVGLPSILVFVSVILGNSLMGVAGMLVFIPAVSVVYTLVKEFVLRREALARPPASDGEEQAL
ncbi:MAG: AI-2E family transporter [Oscillospiraceae bacterium]|nr:AI-2E family transporter [Oscillospiraceae bacterium]